jgi:hexosaminidase
MRNEATRLKWNAVFAATMLLVAGVLANLTVAANALASEPDARIDVIPQPSHVELHSGSFAIRAGTRLSFPRDSASARIAEYFADLLQQSPGIRLNPHPGVGGPGSIEFRIDASATSGARPESYTLDISSDRVIVAAGDARGLLYGAVTLWELSTAATPIPAMRIQDSPRFAWRGLMLDSARHYQSPEFILRLIDWMALHKLNVLQWHLTDDQAWRLEIKKYPRLTSVGAWRVPAGAGPAADIDPATGKPRLYGGFYSQQVVRQIIAHAADRNITVVPEIDIPGHASAAIVAYPRLASIVPAPAIVPSDWGVYSNLYNAEPATFDFLEDVLREVIALFPSRYVHVGGDEAVKDQWRASARIQEQMRELGIADEAGLQSYFVMRMEKFLNARGRQLIGWDEILEGGIAPNATVMSWRGIDGALAAASAGHDAILSPSPTLYLDYLQGNLPNEPPGRATIVSLEDIYGFNPMPPGLAPDRRSHILGVQANIWTEHIRTEERVQLMTFPRAAALAEVAWSPAEKHDWKSFVARLPAQMNRYRALGIHASNDASALNIPVAVRSLDRQALLKRTSHELKSCTDKILLSLEDDAPVSGERAVFLIDIMNPCWIYEQADLSRVTGISAAVGQVPFNFQIGADRQAIKLQPPRSAAGELDVRLDSCDGERIATLSLQPAVGNAAVTLLPAAGISSHAGRHDLCFTFTQRSLDPMWALDSVQLLE